MLVGAAVGRKLNKLRARGGAGAGYIKIQTTQAVDEVIETVIVRLNEPFVVERGICRVGGLDDRRAAARAGALHDHDQAAIPVHHLVISIAGGDELPFVVIRTIAQGARLGRDHRCAIGG